MVLTCFLPSFIALKQNRQAIAAIGLVAPVVSKCIGWKCHRGPIWENTDAPFSTRKTHHFWTRKPAHFRTRKLARFGTRIWHGFSAFLLPFPFSWFPGFLPPVFPVSLVSWSPWFPGLLRLFPGFILSWLFVFPVSRSPGFVGFACLLVFWSLSFLLISYYIISWLFSFLASWSPGFPRF